METEPLFKLNQLLKDPLKIDIQKKNIQSKKIIQGINVYFPYEPYQNQINYMQAVIKLLNAKLNNNSINGIGAFESPTGTGKTLCLLCAIFAWVKEMRERQKYCGQILYTTRTHSQISQVIRELKKTIYQPEIAVLSSRDFTCINNNIKKERRGEALNIFCKVSKKYCHYYNMELIKNVYSNNSIMDIEELCQYGQSMNICPYYQQIYKAKNYSDIVFMPYNYLFVEEIKKSTDIELNNSIIVIDEAHNSPKICEESKSVEINNEDFEKIFKDMEEVSNIIIDKATKIKIKYDENTYPLIIEAISKIKPLEIMSEISAIKNFEKNFNNMKINLLDLNKEQLKKRKNIGKVLSYNELINLFINSNYNRNNINIILFNTKEEDENSYVSFNNTNITQHLNKLLIIKDIYELTNVKMSSVNIIISLLKKLSSFYENDDLINSYKFCICENFNSKKIRYLKIMCFNPALALNDIRIKNPYSIIFTSGTLKPFLKF